MWNALFAIVGGAVVAADTYYTYDAAREAQRQQMVRIILIGGAIVAAAYVLKKAK